MVSLYKLVEGMQSLLPPYLPMAVVQDAQYNASVGPGLFQPLSNSLQRYMQLMEQAKDRLDIIYGNLQTYGPRLKTKVQNAKQIVGDNLDFIVQKLLNPKRPQPALVPIPV